MVDKPPLIEFPQWRILGLILLGMLLVGCAVYLSQRWDLAERLSLDFRGTRAEGSMERNEDGSYRLRLVLGDRIYGRSGKGEFGLKPPEGDRTGVRVVYDPKKPGRFQPFGVSFIPGAIVGLVFLLGMTNILYARRIVQRVQRTRRAQAAPERDKTS